MMPFCHLHSKNIFVLLVVSKPLYLLTYSIAWISHYFIWNNMVYKLTWYKLAYRIYGLFLTTCKNMKTISVPLWLTVRNCINLTKALISHAKVPQCKQDDILISKTRHWNYHTVPLKDNITLACILTLASYCSIMRITWVTCSSLCQFKYYSAPCLKGTTIERRASVCFNPPKLPQVIQSI